MICLHDLTILKANDKHLLTPIAAALNYLRVYGLHKHKSHDVREQKYHSILVIMSVECANAWKLRFFAKFVENF
jgi:hypothetical protein